MPHNNKHNQSRQGTRAHKTQSPKPISLSKGLQPTPPGKTGPASLSMDIVLLIIDALINDAASKEAGLNWGIAYKQDTASKLVLTDMNMSDLNHVKAMKRRFSRIRMASQLNQKSRALVHQTYRRLPRSIMSPAGMTIGFLMTAWVLPSIDDFVVAFEFLGGHIEVLERYANFLGMALHLPTPEGLQFMKCIQKFKIMLPQGLDKHVHAAMVLPNLKELHLGFSMTPIFGPRRPPPIKHAGIVPLRRTDYEDLADWMTMHKRNYSTLCKIFKEKGTTVYAWGCEIRRAVFEILLTEKKVFLRTLEAPTCPVDCECRKIGDSQASATST
ncbi:hypothetical protein CFIO01_10207 [Colletotrichum fioriniae PJ7]|uniref:Uncharacterized protein n=1 Tax=Colletotrichum fioriniae PJ7 TaxID=1445577 RepID=A0A010R2E1_9PEZI|nr:hypothetical protein CFIO01_10207 [Colletotrichum fioriniae PJ7]